MTEPVVVDLFVEDRAHEEFLKPLLERIAAEEGVKVEARIHAARGGHPRAIAEFRLYQRIAERRAHGVPDLAVVAIDGNCASFAQRRREIHNAIAPVFEGKIVTACPDPHVERWYLADPDSFRAVVGYRPMVGKRKCVRDHYKRLLADAVRQGGYPLTLGGIEFAAELVEAMDLYRAARNDASLRAFVQDLRGRLRQLRT